MEDSLEMNFGLIGALLERTGMVSPPPELDWNMSTAVSKIQELNNTPAHNLQTESTPINGRLRKGAGTEIEITPITILQKKFIHVTTGLDESKAPIEVYPPDKDPIEVDPPDKDQEDETEVGDFNRSVEEIKLTFGKYSELSVEMEEKIKHLKSEEELKLAKEIAEHKDPALSRQNESEEDKLNQCKKDEVESKKEEVAIKKKITRINKIGVSKLTTLKMPKNDQHNESDIKLSRCRRCAACKFRCSDCKSCRNEKLKQGCRNRAQCLKKTDNVDEPSLLLGNKKRPLESNEEVDNAPESKEMRLAINSLDLGVSEEHVVAVDETEEGAMRGYRSNPEIQRISIQTLNI